MTQTRPGRLVISGLSSRNPSRHRQVNKSAVSIQDAEDEQSCLPVAHSFITLKGIINPEQWFNYVILDGLVKYYVNMK